MFFLYRAHNNLLKEKYKYCNCLYFSSNALARMMTKMADEEFKSSGVSTSYAFLLITVNENLAFSQWRFRSR